MTIGTSLTDPHAALREQIRAFCAGFPDAYWRDLDARRAYPEEFVAALLRAGWLSTMIPTRYGGRKLSLAEARSEERR